MKVLTENELSCANGGDLAPNVLATSAITIGSGLGAVAGTLLGGPVGGAIGAGVGAGAGTAVGEYSRDIVHAVSEAVLNNDDIRTGMIATDFFLKSLFNF